jgi:TolB-like protein
MIKTLFVTNMLKSTALVIMLAIGINRLYAQEISLNDAIHNSARELSAGIGATARVAVLSIHSNSPELSNYLGNEMIAALANAGNFTVLNQAQVSQVLRSFTFAERLNNTTAQTFGRVLNVQFVVSGEFESIGGNFRLNTRIIEVATAVDRTIYTAIVQSNDRITSMLVLDPIVSLREPREPKPPRVRSNWISLEGSVIGGGLRYERNLNESFSLGFIGFNNWILDAFPGFDNSFTGGALVTTRFYPGGSRFYLELGMGYGGILPEFFYGSSADSEDGRAPPDRVIEHRKAKISEETREYAAGFMIQPAIGFRFGGYRSSFFINPFISVPMAIGTIETTERFFNDGYVVMDYWDYWEEDTKPVNWISLERSSRTGIVARLRVGVSIGFAW